MFISLSGKTNNFEFLMNEIPIDIVKCINRLSYKNTTSYILYIYNIMILIILYVLLYY